MKKSIIAAAIAAAVAAPAAHAGVIVYGKIHASIDYVDTDAVVVSDDWDDNRRTPNTYENVGPGKAWHVVSRTSRIGFKGTEDLGNGLSLIWKAETGYNLDTGGWGGGRNAYIGLAGDWGTFLYGRHDTPYKISTQKLNMFADTIADNNSTIGFDDVRASNAIAYISPNWNGFTVAGAIVPGEDATGDNGLADAYSIAAMYSNNGIYAAAAYEDLGNDNTKWRIGAGYTWNGIRASAIYENHDYDADVSTKLWQLNAAYDFGNNTVKAMYGQNDLDNLENVRSWAIGLDHKLSKRTTAYAVYADSEMGLHNYSYNAKKVLGAGGSSDSEATYGAATGFSLGMMHTF